MNQSKRERKLNNYFISYLSKRNQTNQEIDVFFECLSYYS